MLPRPCCNVEGGPVCAGNWDQICFGFISILVDDGFRGRRGAFESMATSYTAEAYIRPFDLQDHNLRNVLTCKTLKGNLGKQCFISRGVVSFHEASTYNCLPLSQGMIGSGRAHVSEVADLARANVQDDLPSDAVQCFASLGTDGKHPANQERDLHVWLKQLYGVGLAPYLVPMDVHESRLVLISF